MGVCLSIAADDSNHAGKVRGEIIVVGFSLRPGDSESIWLGNRRNYARALDFYNTLDRDWTFTVRGGDQYRHKSDNIISVLPEVLEIYREKIVEKIDEVRVHLDRKFPKRKMGELESKIGEIFFGGGGLVSVRSYTKKVRRSVGRRRAGGGAFSKGYLCPQMLWAADSIANGLFRYHSVRELFGHMKFIGLGRD